MPWGSIISGAGSLLGGLFGSDAASDAAAAQQASTEKAIAEQRRQYDLNRADMAPFMQTGTAANRKLAQLLGLGGTPGGRTTKTAAQLRSELLPQFTKSGDIGGWYESGGGNGGPDGGGGDRMAYRFPSGPIIDENALQAAIEAEMVGQTGIDSTAGDYGSLLRNFSASDLESDPVYQSGLKFGLDQGTGAINQRAIAGGGYDSGATLKALTKYANDYGSTKAGEAYNRYNVNQDRTFNKLSGISGTGQTATQQVGSMGASMANNISGLETDAGNARAAGIVGGANAWNNALGGIGNAANSYFGGKRLKDMLGGMTGSSGWGYETPPYYDYGQGGAQ